MRKHAWRRDEMALDKCRFLTSFQCGEKRLHVLLVSEPNGQAVVFGQMPIQFDRAFEPLAQAGGAILLASRQKDERSNLCTGDSLGDPGFILPAMPAAKDQGRIIVVSGRLRNDRVARRLEGTELRPETLNAGQVRIVCNVTGSETKLGS